ncbi:protein roadkill-like [Planococcus citri]|uniref:protein roadkill-like n=1 Tax=Planococcus citri TaxID=170843 RepID=UPI0031F8C4C0
MSSCQSSFSTCARSEECWCSTVEFHEMERTWNIDDFSVLEQEDETISSSLFSADSNDNFKWYLDFEPECVGYSGKNTMCLYLCLSKEHSTRKRVFAKFGFSILSNDGHSENNFTVGFKYHEFNSESDVDVEGWGNFLSKDDTFKNKFLKNDTLTITFYLTFFEINDKSMPEIFSRCNIAHFQHLSKNLKSAFENRDFTDFTISVEGKEYPVHKIILASCSDYFATMFKTGMKESAENRVVITDVDEAVMDEVLRFIYTGKCENIDYLAYDLLAAADKFDIGHLKKICEDSVYKSLSVDNALNVLILADRHNANELKSKTIDFIVDESSEVMNSTSWNEIMLKHPRLLNEVKERAGSS